MKYFFIMLIIFLSFGVKAGECVNCTIKLVGCSSVYGGVEHCNIYFNEPIANKAECSTSSDNRMAFDISSHGGKGILSIALAAQASGKSVIAYGLKSCELLPPHETINLLYIGKI